MKDKAKKAAVKNILNMQIRRMEHLADDEKSVLFEALQDKMESLDETYERQDNYYRE